MAMEDTFLEETLQSFLQNNHTYPRLACTLLVALHSEINDNRLPSSECAMAPMSPSNNNYTNSYHRLFGSHSSTDRYGHMKEESHAIMDQVKAKYTQGKSMLAVYWDIIADPTLNNSKGSTASLVL